MRHRALLLAAVAGLLIAAVVADPARFATPARSAQEAATPALGADFPPGIEVATLAEGTVDALPETPARFRLDRLTMAPGDERPLLPAPGPELLVVESGAVLIADVLGLEGAYPAGSHLALQAGTPYSIRNDGPADATLLRLSLAPAGAAASPVSASGPNLTAESLLDAEITTLPRPRSASSWPA